MDQETIEAVLYFATLYCNNVHSILEAGEKCYAASRNGVGSQRRLHESGTGKLGLTRASPACWRRFHVLLMLTLLADSLEEKLRYIASATPAAPLIRHTPARPQMQ